MDITNLKKFKELLTTISEINGVVAPRSYILVSNDKISLNEGLSLYDLQSFDYLMVIGEYKWKCGSFVNTSAKLLGMFDKNLNLIDKFPISELMNVIGLDFTKYRNSYYNEYKPILLISNSDGETIRLETEESWWTTDFPKLFEQAFEMAKNKQEN